MPYLGRYDLGPEIGAGGMGTVYRATDTRLHRVVAVKVLQPQKFEHADQLDQVKRRFETEARAAARLDHPNIVRVYDFAEDGGIAYLVMELVDGMSLADKARGRIPVEQMLGILRDTAAALDYAHEKGVIHRDIKPANLVVGHNGVTKLTDFGIARITDVSRFTTTRQMMGTLHFMSPEALNISDDNPVGPLSDQFSFGVVAYEMLAGKKPFEADSIGALTLRIVTAEPPRFELTDKLLAPQLDEIFATVLAKHPTHRFANCRSFADELARVCQGHSRIVTVASQMAEKSAWEHADRQNSTEAIEKFLSSFAEGDWAAAARQRLVEFRSERADWVAVERSGELEALKNFLLLYPRGRFSADAAERIRVLEQESVDWNRLSYSSQVPDVDQFLAKHPNGEHRQAALHLLRHLTKEFTAWISLRDSTREDDLTQFLAEYPDGRFTAEGKRRLEGLRARAEAQVRERSIQEEIDAWGQIKKDADATRIETFLSRYPNGETAAEARQTLLQLRERGPGATLLMGGTPLPYALDGSLPFGERETGATRVMPAEIAKKEVPESAGEPVPPPVSEPIFSRYTETPPDGNSRAFTFLSNPVAWGGVAIAIGLLASVWPAKNTQTETPQERTIKATPFVREVPKNIGTKANSNARRPAPLTQETSRLKPLRQTQPKYPALDLAERIQGVMRFTAMIAKDGTVRDVQFLSGDARLVSAAQEALGQWLYEPPTLNGTPVDVKTTLEVAFDLRPPPPPPPPDPASLPKPPTSALGLVSQVQPVYPAQALQARIEGSVRFRATIGTNGAVKSLQLVYGHPLLLDAARKAALQWQYSPTIVNGVAVEGVTQIDLNFKLP